MQLVAETNNDESGTTPFGMDDVESLALKANSSRARRLLAGACGKLFEDVSLWGKSGNDDLDRYTDWMSRSLDSLFSTCAFED